MSRQAAGNGWRADALAAPQPQQRGPGQRRARQPGDHQQKAQGQQHVHRPYMGRAARSSSQQRPVVFGQVGLAMFEDEITQRLGRR